MAFNAIIISVFICLTYCSFVSGLSLKAFDSFKGYPFCTYGTAAQFKQMCLKMGNQLGYAAFDESYLNDLQCEEKKVWLMDYDSEEEEKWVSREPYLLECIYYWNYDGSKSTQYLSDGQRYADVYRFSPDSQGDLTGDQNYTNFLKSIFRDL